MNDANRNNQIWIFWLLTTIVTLYLLLTLNWLAKNQQQQLKLQTTLDAVPLLLPLQQLGRQLQAERGMLSGFATQQLPARPPIELQQLQTDAAWRDLELALADTQAQTLSSYLLTLPKQQQLFLLRQQVIEHQLSSTQVKQAYTELLLPLLGFAQYLQTKNELAQLRGALSGIQTLTEALERAGQERATLHIAFAQRQMSPSRYQSYVILMNEQLDYLRQVPSFASAELQQEWLMVQSQIENGAFTELRDLALAQQFEGDPALWFALASSRIDQLYQFRTKLCHQLQRLTEDMAQQLDKTNQQLLTQLQTLLLIFLLTAWRLYRLHYVQSPPIKPVRHSAQY